MTPDAGLARSAAPWHFWIVGVLALLWNGFAGYDYTMSHVQGDAYYRQLGMTEAQITFMHAYPAWVTAAWAVGVWGSVVGAILLLARSRYAVHAFVVSLAGLLASLVYNFLLSNGAEVMGQMGSIMNVVILAILLFLIWYAWTMAKRGVLR
jgi:membrane-anchored protein YejM (alkaline phosphatase superfamily)